MFASPPQFCARCKFDQEAFSLFPIIKKNIEQHQTQNRSLWLFHLKLQAFFDPFIYLLEVI